MDPALVPLYEASLELYAGLGHGFECPPSRPALLVVGATRRLRATEPRRGAVPRAAPEWLEGAGLQAAEPALAADLVRLPARHRPPGPARRGRPAPWRRARARRGARIEIGRRAPRRA